MSADWYFSSGDLEYGPYSGAVLKQYAQSGRIQPQTPVKKGREGRWVRAERVRGLFVAPTPPPSSTRSVPGTGGSPTVGRPGSRSAGFEGNPLPEEESLPSAIFPDEGDTQFPADPRFEPKQDGPLVHESIRRARTCKADVPLNHFFFGTVFGFVALVLLAAAVGLVVAMIKDESDPGFLAFVAILLAICGGVPAC